jgi:hypothetical protein
MTTKQKHTWSVCPDCGGYSSEGHTGTERCRAYKAQPPATPAQGKMTRLALHASLALAEQERDQAVRQAHDSARQAEHFAQDLIKAQAQVADLLAACKRLLPHAKRGVEQLNSRMVGSLYPALNQSDVDDAQAAIARAEKTTNQ